ncbi:MAG TPA: hypothetical protein VGX76_16385 [Pirellulales bacterium]|nr:hypothetical protein [Pirellulales bacterium]
MTGLPKGIDPNECGRTPRGRAGATRPAWANGLCDPAADGRAAQCDREGDRRPLPTLGRLGR